MSARCTAAERDLRVGRVVEWVAEGQSRANIVRLCRAEWDIKPRTVDAYIQRARHLIDSESRATARAELQGARREARAESLDEMAPTFEALPERDQVRLDVLNMLYEQYALAKLNGDPATALKAAEKLAELMGVRWADMQSVLGDDDDLEAQQKKARDAFAMMMGGAQALRADRDLPALPERPDAPPAEQGDGR